jgi:hypothetical protein
MKLDLFLCLATAAYAAPIPRVGDKLSAAAGRAWDNVDGALTRARQAIQQRVQGRGKVEGVEVKAEKITLPAEGYNVVPYHTKQPKGPEPYGILPARAENVPKYMREMAAELEKERELLKTGFQKVEKKIGDMDTLSIDRNMEKIRHSLEKSEARISELTKDVQYLRNMHIWKDGLDNHVWRKWQEKYLDAYPKRPNPSVREVVNFAQRKLAKAKNSMNAQKHTYILLNRQKREDLYKIQRELDLRREKELDRIGAVLGTANVVIGGALGFEAGKALRSTLSPKVDPNNDDRHRDHEAVKPDTPSVLSGVKQPLVEPVPDLLTQ